MPTEAPAAPDGGGWPARRWMHPHWSGLPPWGRRLLVAGLRAWTLLPWAALALAGAAVGLRRWPGPAGLASAALCWLAAAGGWAVLWRAAVRELDVAVTEILLAAGIPDPAPWALFPQREEIVKAAHWRACLARHGVNPRSSGWGQLAGRTAAGARRALAVALLLCAPATVHPWWLP